MLSVVDANLLVQQHLGDASRAEHSRFVAHIMRELAPQFSAPADLWEVVGLCHDLDYFHTQGNWSQHGLTTVAWLGDKIPVEAQHAIAAHDHRTGVQADTLLADMLKVADALAVIDEKIGRVSLCETDRTAPYPALRHQLGDRSYLGDILERYADKHGVSFDLLVGSVALARRQ